MRPRALGLSLYGSAFTLEIGSSFGIISTNRAKTAAHSGDKISESSIVVRVRRL